MPHYADVATHSLIVPLGDSRYLERKYDSRIIAAAAESILPRSFPRAFVGLNPASRSRDCASTDDMRSSQVIIGISVNFLRAAQNACTLRTAGPLVPSSDKGKPTTIELASISAACSITFFASFRTSASRASIGVAIVPVGSDTASPILTSP